MMTSIRTTNVSHLAAWALLVAALGAPAAAQPLEGVSQPPEALSGWARYEILFQRNIFSMQRQPMRANGGGAPAGTGSGEPSQTRDEDGTASSGTPSQAPADPLAGLVLCGVAIHDGQAVAFIEDRQAGKTLLIAAGQPIGPARLVAIGLDEVTIDIEGETRVVEIGYSLAGELGKPSAATASPASTAADAPEPSETSETSAGAAPPTGEAGILERMRRARQQQLNSP